MKWLVWLIVVLWFPILAQAEKPHDELVHFDGVGLTEDISDFVYVDQQDWDFPASLFFGVQPTKNLDDVILNFELEVEPWVTPEQIKAAQCGILWQQAPTWQTKEMFPTHRDDDMDLWFPFLAKGTKVAILIGWKEPIQHIVYRTSRMQSEHKEQIIRSHEARELIRRRKLQHPAKLRTVRLQDICEQFVTVPPKS